MSDWWDNIRYFKAAEFACTCGSDRCTGDEAVARVTMSTLFVQDLDYLRAELGVPFYISSGLRCPHHPAEVNKSAPGTHQLGKAVDILLHGYAVHDLLLQLPQAPTIGGIGLKQHGDIEKRFVHLDCAPSLTFRPRPWVWSYE